MAETTRQLTAAEEALAQRFSSLAANDPFYSARAEAFRSIEEKGLPNRRIEDWKYTDLRRLMETAPELSKRVSLDGAKAALGRIESRVEGIRLPFINGFYFAELADELPEGVRVVSFADALEASDNLDRFNRPGNSDNTIFNLNEAFSQDGLAIVVEAGRKIDLPIKIWNIALGDTPVMSVMRHAIIVEDGAECTFIERYAACSEGSYQTNCVTQLHVQSGAHVTYVRDQHESRNALHLSALVARIEADAVFTPFSFTKGAAVSRMESHITFAAPGAIGALKGVTLLGGSQHADHTMVVDHAAPACESTEQFNSVLLDGSTSVFQGRIGVRQIAQKTDAKMMSRALILSDNATFNTKPELEIFADDVQCGHGATIADIDDEPLFYLMARGIPRAVAERMLVEAFLSELIDELDNEALRDTFNGYVHAYFDEREAL